MGFRGALTVGPSYNGQPNLQLGMPRFVPTLPALVAWTIAHLWTIFKNSAALRNVTQHHPQRLRNCSQCLNTTILISTLSSSCLIPPTIIPSAVKDAGYVSPTPYSFKTFAQRANYRVLNITSAVPEMLTHMGTQIPLRSCRVPFTYSNAARTSRPKLSSTASHLRHTSPATSSHGAPNTAGPRLCPASHSLCKARWVHLCARL
jgi:hypothetical protein